MSRPVHFEIHVADVQRSMDFYAEVFGWAYEDWSNVTGTPYWGVITGDDSDTPGINGAIMQGNHPEERGTPVNGAVLTMAVDDYDAVHEKILANGGEEALPKAAIPGMAWQGYFLDPDRNVFGIHQPDPEAK